METIILIIHVLASVAVVGLILLQQGKGAETGASFGAGASQTVFGSQGSATFLSRVTAVLATVFFVTSFSLAIVARQRADSVTGAGLPSVAEEVVPANDAPIATEGGVVNDAPVLDSQPAAQPEEVSEQASEEDSEQSPPQ